MLKNILTISAVMLLAACSSHSASSETVKPTTLPDKITLSAVPMILDPTQLPPEPGVDNNKTVAGIDSNNNGIRDDVERWIAQSYPTSAKMRAAAAQVVLSLQYKITNKAITEEIAYQKGIISINAVCCLVDSSAKTGVKDNLNNIMSVHLNTRQRVNAYNQFHNIMGSRAFVAPQIDTCDIPSSQLPN